MSSEITFVATTALLAILLWRPGRWVVYRVIDAVPWLRNRAARDWDEWDRNYGKGPRS